MSQSATEKGWGECQFIWDGKCKGTECWLAFGPVLACDWCSVKWEIVGRNVQNVQIVFHSLATEYIFLDMYSCPFFFFLIICLPLTPTVSHDSWDDFCSHISWYFHFKGKVLTTSLTTIHIIIRISISSHGAAILSLAHPISCFSFVYTFMNDLNSAVQTPQDSTTSSDVFRDQKKLVLHVSPKCWCLVPQMLLCSAFRWT